MNEYSQRINVIASTQHVEVEAPNQITVTNAGPVGPPGITSVIGGVGVEEIDSRIATHDQTTTAHENSKSGLDFSALIRNGLT